MKPCFGICGYQCFKEVFRMHGTLDPRIPKIFIDGKYPKFEAPNDYSDDGTIEFLESQDYIVEKLAGEQVDKRNAYLERAGKEGFDCVIVVDTDEFVPPGHNDWVMFRSMLDYFVKKKLGYIFGLWYWVTPDWRRNLNIAFNYTWVPYMRIIMKPEEIKYDLTHWRIVHKDAKPVNCTGMADGVRLHGNSILRSKEYQKTGYDWSKAQLKEEKIRMNQEGKQALMNLQNALALPGTTIMGPDGKFHKVEKVES